MYLHSARIFLLFFTTHVQFCAFNTFPLFTFTPSEWTGSSGSGGRWVRGSWLALMCLVCFVCKIHRTRNSRRENMARKVLNSPTEQKGGDKDACCGVFPLIKIDFFPHRIPLDYSESTAAVQSCCSYSFFSHSLLLFLSFSFRFPNRDEDDFTLSLTVSLVHRKHGGGDWKKGNEYEQGMWNVSIKKKRKRRRENIWMNVTKSTEQREGVDG